MTSEDQGQITMANSKLLKEAIADAKAVRETALANAKIQLAEAFAPRLSSMLSKKLQAEMQDNEEDMEDVKEGEEMEAEKDEEKPEGVYETLTSSGIGKAGAGSGTDGKQPSYTDDADTLQLGLSDTDNQSSEVGKEDEEYTEVDSLMEEEEPSMDMDSEEDSDDDSDDDDLDLDEIIKELEDELSKGEEADDTADDTAVEEAEEMDEPTEKPEADMSEEENADDVIDIEEIIKELEDEEAAEKAGEEEKSQVDALSSDLEEAYGVIKQLKSTINEVNLLNAKLLFANKLFRAFNMTNEQKSKVIDTLDRTSNVREVKLVYSTLAESMKFGGNTQAKKNITEGIASKAQKSTAPSKQIISESKSEAFADRFKQLAGIIK
jgi:hypothetical protein